jgi:hypothetical protein
VGGCAERPNPDSPRSDIRLDSSIALCPSCFRTPSKARRESVTFRVFFCEETALFLAEPGGRWEYKKIPQRRLPGCRLGLGARPASGSESEPQAARLQCPGCGAGAGPPLTGPSLRRSPTSLRLALLSPGPSLFPSPLPLLHPLRLGAQSVRVTGGLRVLSRSDSDGFASLGVSDVLFVTSRAQPET